MKDICHIMAVCVILNNIAPFDEVKSVGSFYTVLIRWLPFIYFKFLQSTFFKTKLHGVGVPEHGGQRPTSYEPFSCPSLSFFEMILHCRALRATLSSILIDHKNIFGQSRNSALSAVGRDVAGGRKRSAAVLFRIRCQLRRIPFLACLLGGRNLHESERISS